MKIFNGLLSLAVVLALCVMLVSVVLAQEPQPSDEPAAVEGAKSQQVRGNDVIEPTLTPTAEATEPPTEEATEPPAEATEPPTEEATEPVEEIIENVEEEIVEPLEEVVEPVGAEIESFEAASVSSASARTAPWTVAVTYQNVGNGPATITVQFYPEGSATPYTYNAPALNAGAGASFAVGSITTSPAMPASFKGGAVMSSNQPLVATVVQFSPNATDNVLKQMRLLSNGFQSSDAASQYLIATTLLNKFDRTTVFSIQNTESVPINATIRFYNADAGGVLAGQKTHTIPANSVKIIEMDDCSDTGLFGCPTVFNGSAIITAVKTSGGAANVVAAASEYYVNRNVGANFEGVPLSQAATTIYMATGLCRTFGLDTFYAVQNASLTSDAYIEVTYRNTSGAIVAKDGRYKIGPGQKKSINTCAPSDGTNMTGFTGSAVIKSYNAMSGSTPGAPIVAIGKAQTSLAAPTPGTANAFTAFMSQPSGVSKIALPFIRWANDSNFNANNPGKQRTFIAIQNLENSAIQVRVTYKDKNGNTVGTPQLLTIPQFSKANSDPKSAGVLGGSGMVSGEFGYYTDGSFGGGAIIEAVSPSTAKFIAIVRANNGGGGSEDYNGPAAP